MSYKISDERLEHLANVCGPNATPAMLEIESALRELRELRATVAAQEAHIQSLQNRWAIRPLDHADGEALIAENRRLQAQLKAREDKPLDPMAAALKAMHDAQEDKT